VKALKGYLLIAAAASFWGVAGTAAKYLLSTLAAALSFAFFNIYGRTSSLRYPTWTVLLYTLLFASAFWVDVNPPWEIVEAHYELKDWMIFLVLAVILILIPYTLYFHGMKHILSSRAIITSTLELIVAVATA